MPSVASSKRSRPRPRWWSPHRPSATTATAATSNLLRRPVPVRVFFQTSARPGRTATSTLAPRVVQLRFGVILTARGGALPRLLRLFRLGLGGRLGSGRQWMSWVSLEDTVAAIQFAIAEPHLSGAFNTTSPHPVTNAEFTRILGRTLRRPTLFRVPSLVLLAALGEMAQDTLLASTRAIPERLHSAGFQFTHERLEQTISEMV